MTSHSPCAAHLLKLRKKAAKLLCRLDDCIRVSELGPRTTRPKRCVAKRSRQALGLPKVPCLQFLAHNPDQRTRPTGFLAKCCQRAFQNFAISAIGIANYDKSIAGN